MQRVARGRRCLAIAAVALGGCAHPGAPAPAPVLPLPFSATGTEPGWHLAMTEQRLVLQAAYGTVRIEVDTPAARHVDDALVYHANTSGHRVTVAARHRYCTNAMSGMPHPWSVSVTLDGERFDGCGGDPAALLTGAPWQLQTLDGTPLPPQPPVTLSFAADGSLSGHGGCNRFRGSYALTGEGITISPLAATRMSCGAADAVEQRLLQALAQVRRFRLETSGTLVLETAGGGILTARRSA